MIAICEIKMEKLYNLYNYDLVTNNRKQI